MGKRIPGRNENMCKPQRQGRPWHRGSGNDYCFLMCVFLHDSWEGGRRGKRAGRVQGVVC